MKKIQRIILGVVIMTITAAELAACIPHRQDDENQICAMLEEKYGEAFEIAEYTGENSIEQSYEVIAFSQEHPDVLFEAKAARDGSFIEDEYVASRVCREIEEQIEQNLGTFPGYMQVKILALSKAVRPEDPDMSPEKFVSLKPKNRFAVYFHCCPEEQSAVEIYASLTNMFAGLNFLSGNIRFYAMDETMLREVQEYMEDCPKPYNEYEKLVENETKITIPFENGVIQMTEDEFYAEAGDAL